MMTWYKNLGGTIQFDGDVEIKILKERKLPQISPVLTFAHE
jgi:hypothetical protein